MLPNISRSGASVIRRPPKFFSYQFAAAAVSGTLMWMWSYGSVGVWAARAGGPAENDRRRRAEREDSSAHIAP